MSILGEFSGPSPEKSVISYPPCWSTPTCSRSAAPDVSKPRSFSVNSSLLDLSDRVTLQPLARLLAAVRAAAGSRPLLLVGAAARDLLLVHGHHIAVRRATEDTDVALAVPDWFSFLGVRDGLIASPAFRPDVALHRLWFGDQRLDFIPFGGVERLDRTIAWPPESAQVMNVSGFAEALATAVTVRLPGGVDFDVASLPALALLKIWAWNDRKYVAPGKDAEDLLNFSITRMRLTWTGSMVGTERRRSRHSISIWKWRERGFSVGIHATSWVMAPTLRAPWRL